MSLGSSTRASAQERVSSRRELYCAPQKFCPSLSGVFIPGVIGNAEAKDRKRFDAIYVSRHGWWRGMGRGGFRSRHRSSICKLAVGMAWLYSLVQVPPPGAETNGEQLYNSECVLRDHHESGDHHELLVHDTGHLCNRGEATTCESDPENRLRSKGEPQRKLDLPVSPLSGGNRARAADTSRRTG